MKFDTEGFIRRAKAIFDEDAEAKRELDRQMVATMEKMHAALVEANQREADADKRAKAAEAREVAAQTHSDRRDTFMVVLTALSLIAAVVAIIVAANAG